MTVNESEGGMRICYGAAQHECAIQWCSVHGDNLITAIILKVLLFFLSLWRLLL